MLEADIGRKVKLTDEEMAVFDRDHSPTRAASFERFCWIQTLYRSSFEPYPMKR